jgi:glycosyltransferase involved in cell wall biosynthesis
VPDPCELLYISPTVPDVAGNGQAMRAGAVLRALAEQYAVSLLVAPLYCPPGAPVPTPIAALCRRVHVAAAATVPLATPAGFEPGRFGGVHVFRLAALPFAEPYLLAAEQLHLDLDDVESVSRRRLAALHRLRGEVEAARVEESAAEQADRLEALALRRFDRLYVCAEGDRARLQARPGRAALCVLPNTVPVPAAPAPATPPRPGAAFRFLFVGTLGYFPNRDAVEHFAGAVVPRLRADAGQPFRFAVVGAGAGPELAALALAVPEVELIGWVPDVAPHYAAADAVVVPLRAAGGTRIKVLEAFAQARPVVSSSMGVEGLAVRDGEHALLGDTPEALARQCLRLMADPALGARLAEQGLALLRRAYTPEALAEALSRCGAPPPARGS